MNLLEENALDTSIVHNDKVLVVYLVVDVMVGGIRTSPSFLIDISNSQMFISDPGQLQGTAVLTLAMSGKARVTRFYSIKEVNTNSIDITIVEIIGVVSRTSCRVVSLGCV